ncbi:MAG: glycosyltransferase family 39 protein [Pirellulaceae bacterium]
MKRELILLAIVLVVGFAARLFALSQAAVEHFDEGVYASNLYFGPPDYAYPQRHLYAPPLLPASIEAGMIAGLPPNLAALLPSFLTGCGTIVALWWFGRSWFAPRVGLAAAALCALSDFHIAYSAAALTDVLLGLWLLLAVDAIGRSLLKTDYRWAIGAGVYCGLAWWTKYNGWLPLAIEAAALPIAWLLLRPSSKQLAGWLGCWAVTALVAAAILSPFLLSLQASGGYGPIAANHAKYVVGLAGWVNSLSRQIASQHILESGLSPFAMGVSLVVADMLFSLRAERGLLPVSRRTTTLVIGTLVLGSIVLAAIGTSFLVLTAAAAVGLSIRTILLARSQPQDDEARRAIFGVSLVAAWWLGLLVATPCYWPYPRLVAPWLLASWLGAALCWDQVLRAWADPRRADALRTGVRQRLVLLGGVWLAMIVAAIIGWTQRPPAETISPWTDRQGLQRVAVGIQKELGPESRAVYIYGEPALFFQLSAAGEVATAPVQSIPQEPTRQGTRVVPTYLAIGPHAWVDSAFRRDWAARQLDWKLVGSYSLRLSPLVSLDLYDPRSQAFAADAQGSTVRLYRLLGSVPPRE